MSGPTPRELGYRMPAEWEPQKALWLSWPNPRGESFPHVIDEAKEAFVHLIDATAEYALVYVNCSSPEAVDEVRSRVAAPARVELFDVPTREPWCRDIAPSFVVNPGADKPLAAVKWIFNAWGGKYQSGDSALDALDNAAGRAMARRLGVPIFEPGIEFEGGGVEVNGAGTALTSRSCLLNDNRNSGLSQVAAETILRDFLGVDHVLWIDGANIRGDDTDGHVDVTTRFVGPERIAVAVEDREDHANYGPLRRNFAELAEARTPAGERYELVALPMPRNDLWDETWRTWLPAGYANFQVVNGAVLAPAFDDPVDDEAHECLQKCFPGHALVPVDSRVFITGQGGIHCLAQPVPDTSSTRYQPSR